jgi:hypothetical protein
MFRRMLRSKECSWRSCGSGSCWIRTYLLPPRAGLVDEGLPTVDGAPRDSFDGGENRGTRRATVDARRLSRTLCGELVAVEIYRG